MQLSLKLNKTSPGKHANNVSIIDEMSFWKSTSLTSGKPNALEEVLPGVCWGDYHQLFTPAYWKLQYDLTGLSAPIVSHRLGENIIEEVVACLLGGYGIPAEIGLLALQRLKQEGLIRQNVSENDLQTVLAKPLTQANQKQVKYRFPKQKSKYIARFLSESSLKHIPVNGDDLVLRDWLLQVEGIGPKTASWITRNWLCSERVAIIDIHLLRAGMLAGFFPLKADITKDYAYLESRYLLFCRAIGVRPSIMDAIIWQQMKEANHIAIQLLNTKSN